MTPRVRRGHERLRFTAIEAAALLGVEPNTITQWAARGRLSAAGRRGRAHTYFWAELVEVEYQTRRSGTLPRPRRVSDDPS